VLVGRVDEQKHSNHSDNEEEEEEEGDLEEESQLVEGGVEEEEEEDEVEVRFGDEQTKDRSRSRSIGFMISAEYEV